MRKTALSVMAAALAVAVSHAKADQLGTVWEIALENHNFTQPSGPGSGSPQQLFGNTAAPYLNSLVTPGNPNAQYTAYATNYLSAGSGTHPSEPNYVWDEAGTNLNPGNGYLINNDNDPNSSNTFVNVPHLTQQMNDAGVTWKNYQEDFQITNATTPTGGSALTSKSGTSTTVTNPYYATNQYNYAAKHDPQAFFGGTGNYNTQTQNLNTFDRLRSDIAADTVTVSNPTATSNFGQYNWITPNQYNDMHSSLSGTFTYHGVGYTGDQSAIATGDNFLSIIIPQIMATQAWQDNGAIIIWMDETEGGDGTDHTLNEIVISKLALGDAGISSVEMNHSSDIKTMEELFQLGGTLSNPTSSTEPYLGLTSNTVSGANDISSLFKPGTIPSTVPEPASLTLLAIGATALIGRRARKA